jgi:hypothetical protein
MKRERMIDGDQQQAGADEHEVHHARLGHDEAADERGGEERRADAAGEIEPERLVIVRETTPRAIGR